MRVLIEGVGQGVGRGCWLRLLVEGVGRGCWKDAIHFYTFQHPSHSITPSNQHPRPTPSNQHPQINTLKSTPSNQHPQSAPSTNTPATQSTPSINALDQQPLQFRYTVAFVWS